MTTAPSFAEIQVMGADARSFLHSQLASDIRVIEPGHWRYGSYCAADGRVQALMLVASETAEHWRLLLPADLAAAVAQRLQRYRLRARCSIDCAEVTVAVDQTAPAAGVARYQSDAFCWQIAAGPASPLAPALWAQQLRLGIPWLIAATSERFLPQMLALERLQAYSLRKGCFPGQEIVARTHYLGRSKRRLVRLGMSREGCCADPGSELCEVESGNNVGILIAADDAGAALAVVAESATVGATLGSVHAAKTAAFVIESDIIETIGDAGLNSRYHPPFSA